jgi:hypothetical protein
MNATRTGFTSGVHRIRGVAVALILLALLASGAAGYFIRVLSTPSPAPVVTHAPAAASTGVSSNPVGDRWWQDQPGQAGSSVSVDAWWKDMH